MISDDRLKHSISVARKMKEIAENKYNMNSEEINEMFVVGLLHDIGYEYTESVPEHNHIGGDVLEKSGFKYWEEVYNHGEIDIEFSSRVLDILNEADLNIDRKGNYVGVINRLEDIKLRYGVESNIYIKMVRLAKSLNLI